MAFRDKRFRWRWIAFALLGLVVTLLGVCAAVLLHTTKVLQGEMGLLRWLIAGQFILVLMIVLVVTWGVRIQRREFQRMLKTQRELCESEETLRQTTERLERHNEAIAERAHSSDLFGADPARAYRAHTEVAARTLRVERVSIWFFTANFGAIRCEDLFEATPDRHSSGVELASSVYPKYFAALATGRSIAAHNARLDERTAEFSRDYLVPLGITSMLDIPVRRAGQLVGVLCIEHVGPAREWRPDEEAFAASLSDLLTIALEIWRHRETEAALRDATEHLEAKVGARTRELAEANTRLQSVDQLKSEFIATMSHELRTPLNSILGFTGVLRQGLAGPLNEEQARQLGMVHSASRHLLTLINDILDLSRIESGRVELKVERFPLAPLVREIVEQLRPLAEPKNLALLVTLPPSEVIVSNDRKRCLQILLNLAGNAVKFTEKGHVTIAVHEGHGGIEICVSDSGIGIRAEHLPNLFQAFRQVDGSARRVYEGTGLGLYLCRKLTSLLGGDIRVESTFGVGSCFTVTLPDIHAP